jgi:biotin-(acetyl-CoA carboxylase) ligase
VKTLNIQDLLKHYKIDVKHIDLDDTFELEDMFHTRKEIVKKFNKLSLDEVKEFLKAEQELSKYLPEIKKRYKTFYEKKVEPVSEELKDKLKILKEYISLVYS